MTTRETGAATQAQDDVCRLADLYCETKDRIVGLLDDPDAAQWNRPVPACPGWSVRDVVAHLTAVALDLLDGRLTVPPSVPPEIRIMSGRNSRIRWICS